MKSKIFIYSALLAWAGSAAADRAVQEVNFAAGVQGGYSKGHSSAGYSSADFHDFFAGINGGAALPIGEYFGASISAAYGLGGTKVESTYGNSNIEGNSLDGGLTLFFRNPRFGRVAAGYSRSRGSYSSSINGGPYGSNVTATSYSYHGLVEGYLGPVTLMINKDRNYDTGSAINTDFVSSGVARASWYVIPNIRVGAQVGFDSADGVYGADLEFQPSFFGKIASMYVEYTRNAGNGFASNSLSVGFNLYFNSRVDLQTRDRHYR